MPARILSLAAVLATTLVASVASAQPLRVEIRDGYVTIHAQEVPVRQILAEWARVGGVKIVNGERVGGAPLTLELVRVPEKVALETVLRSASGYMAIPRASAAAGSSYFDRIVILPTSVAVAATGRPPGVAQPPMAGLPVERQPLLPQQPVNDDQEPDAPVPAPGMPGYPGMNPNAPGVFPANPGFSPTIGGANPGTPGFVPQPTAIPPPTSAPIGPGLYPGASPLMPVTPDSGPNAPTGGATPQLPPWLNPAAGSRQPGVVTPVPPQPGQQPPAPRRPPND